MKHPKIIENYKIGKVIGTGTFGKVREAQHIPTQQKVAIKILQKKKIKTNKDLQRIHKQLSILKNINHPNILKLLDVIQTNQYIFIITQLISGQEMYDLIVKRGKLSLNQACIYFSQLYQAVKFLHSNNIAHRDIKPQNIIVNGSSLKLIDFGLSAEWTNKNMMETPCGSPCYAAPQMVIGKKYDSRKVDIWSMGITLYAMLVGKLPYQHENTIKLYRLIQTTQFQDIKQIPSYVNILLHAMIQKNPKKRITIKDIQNNIWIRDILKENKNNMKNNSQYNRQIIKQMELKYKTSEQNIIKNLNEYPISQLATYYYLKNHKYIRNSNLNQDQYHDGPFHINFVFKNVQLLQKYLVTNSIDFQWVNNNKFMASSLNQSAVSNSQIFQKKQLLINGQIITIKKLKNMAKLIYLPLNHHILAVNKQNNSTLSFKKNCQRSHTHLDSNRSNIDNLCIQTF